MPQHGTDMNHLCTRGLDDGPATRIDQAAAMVVPFLDIGRVGALHQRKKCLVRDRQQAVVHDFERDRVQIAGF